MEPLIIEADLAVEVHCEHILFLTNAYSKDVMGGGKPLPEFVQKNLITGLKETPNSLTFLAYDGDQPIGIANCFIGYSTFYAQKLINIHDLGVIQEARGKGIGKKLIDAVYEKAKAMDGCKVTLEVLENNPARRLYEREGFEYGDPRFFFMTRLVK
tara:strand:- start:88100 stop:88567 length:468 start_codon:yes stop_codon:yes gene_type:complete